MWGDGYGRLCAGLGYSVQDLFVPVPNYGPPSIKQMDGILGERAPVYGVHVMRD